MCVQVCSPGKSKGCYDCCLAFIYHFFNTHELEGQPWGALVKAKLQSCEWIQWGLIIIKSMRPRIRPPGTESHLWKKKKKKLGWHLPCLGSVFREGNGTPLEYSCLENPWAEEPGAVHGVAKNWTRLSDLAAAGSVFFERMEMLSLLLGGY